MGKRGKLYLKFTVVAAILFTLAFSLYTLAANPSASPAIVSDRNFSGSNISSAFANNIIFGFANILIAFVGYLRLRSVTFTSQNGTTEANSTFKWFKRTMYQPQNRSFEVRL